ncbi:pyruvate kinase [Beggiatoa leptomitoformis]|uniref:Pyruvate kinase n=1 Tax=Beggiatoa leptomitoformis TaxID=288004 RepID=A0A2N9YC82_9GAMM|nr:pyruvate kinase [Beggiatoa leptomitoformis]ALG66640.1 pyruvate kinase [Beggiatoa leptomitoformis]AUI68042.1 pyruvate kinase [Beggiatoa leptomitoformis]
MPRRTKIIATLGPATDAPAMLEKIIQAGVDIVRLNFSHGTVENHQQRFDAVRQCARALGRHVAVMADLQGPKIRIEKFQTGRITLSEGDNFILDAACPSDAGTQERVGLTYKQLPRDVRANDTLLLDDGRIVLGVEKVEQTLIFCRVQVGGTLSNNKGINRLGGGLSAETLTHKDRTDLIAAAKMGVDYLAISFPRSAENVHEARRLLQAAGSKAGIVAKIERAEAVTNYEEIIRAADVIMVARGDLGVEIGDAALPAVQKMLIKKTRDLNKVVITATQMMESMIENPIPTRAEVSDVANAVFDGTDAVMLSAETASGKYPDKAVIAMDRVCQEAEKQPMTRVSDHRLALHFGRIDEAIAMATMYTANHLDVKAIVSLTESGSTPLWMSRISSGIPIYAFSRHLETCQKVTLYRGVYPVHLDLAAFDIVEVNHAVLNRLQSSGAVSDGDLVIITKGDLRGISGGTNLMKVICVGDEKTLINV